MGGDEFKWRQPAYHQLWSQQGPHFSPHSTAKTNDKSTFLRKNGLYSGRSDVAIASVHSEKTRLKKTIMIISVIIMNKSQETTIFSGHQKLTFRLKLRPEKLWLTSNLILYTAKSS